MLEKTSRFMRKHCFADEPHCGDYLSVCKVCNQKAWLIEDIKHRSDCEVGGVLKEIRGATEADDERKALVDDERGKIRDKAIVEKSGKRAARTNRRRSAGRGE